MLIDIVLMLGVVVSLFSDIDECLSGVAGCSQGCVNREGGFNCKCEFGYTLNDDRKTCAVSSGIICTIMVPNTRNFKNHLNKNINKSLKHI